jgi:hypothetical protein
MSQSIMSEGRLKCACGQEGLIVRVITAMEESTGFRLPKGFHLETRDGLQYLVCYLCNEPVQYIWRKAIGGVACNNRRLDDWRRELAPYPKNGESERFSGCTDDCEGTATAVAGVVTDG